MTYDLVIRNGVVVDGSGLGSYRADVGVQGASIARVGRIREAGQHEIDAEGHVVTPGFIDGHTHMDAQVFWDPLGSPSCWHGVTTAVMGHCGFTLAPAPPEQRHLVVRNLERAEDISGEAMAAGIDWTWTTFAEYLDAVDGLPKGINYAANIGHSALRTFAMGERAFVEEATRDDLRAMETELRSAMRAGAFGFSTSRTHHHETSDDRPVASRIATWDEVRHLVLAMGDEGSGVFQFVEDPPSQEERNERDARIIALAVESGVPFAIGATGSNPRALALIDATAEAGGRMVGLTHCRGIGTVSSFRTQLPFDSLPEWREVRELAFDQLRIALQDPSVRGRLVRAAHQGTYGKALGGSARPPDFERMQVLTRPVPPHQTVGEGARARGVDPVEFMIDLALASDFDQLFVQTNSPFDHDAVRAVMKHPRTVMSFSDSGAHVSQMSDCSIYTHFLAHWVRDREDFTLDEAVRMLTLAPARAWGFHDRGLIREGMVADLNVFDPSAVGPEMPRVVRDLPAGAPRLRQTAAGFLATIVAGEIVHSRGQHTGALPGSLIRGPLAPRSSASRLSPPPGEQTP
jgi:N-acyl-D-aspartate/D-glutamate deacylase